MQFVYTTYDTKPEKLHLQSTGSLNQFITTVPGTEYKEI